ncbi:MAG: NAD(P)-dependent alcohol dehydrogenase [Eubacteriales bacterium]|nr:NAD(P)-dependent alcohol dehydrogenase [Eubacteriales bacterium]
MKVAEMTEKQTIRFRETEIPAPGRGELLIKIDYVGVCGSDVHLYQTASCGGKAVTAPCVLGHEAAGVVVKAGVGAGGFSPGDQVAIEPQKPCMECAFCKSGRYNLCPQVKFYASPPTMEGCFAEYVVHPAGFCYRLPASVSTLEGALIEPLSVGLHAVGQSGVQAGQTAAVIGAGCIGLTVVLALLARGVKKVFVIDVMENRLALAQTLGCYRTINSAETDAAEYLQQAVGGVDAVFEAAGRPQTIQQAGLMAKRGGTVTLIGYPVERQASLYVNHLINNEITIKTAFRYRNTYPLAIEMLENGLPLKKLVSDIYPFDKVEDGLRRAMNCKNEVTKCVIRIGADPSGEGEA